MAILPTKTQPFYFLVEMPLFSKESHVDYLPFLTGDDLDSKLTWAKSQDATRELANCLEEASDPETAFAQECRDAALRTLVTFLADKGFSHSLLNNIPEKIPVTWLWEFEGSFEKPEELPNDPDLDLLQSLFCLGIHHLKTFSKTKESLIQEALEFNPRSLDPSNFVDIHRNEFDICEIKACRKFTTKALVSQIFAARYLNSYSDVINYPSRGEELLIIFLKVFCPYTPLYQFVRNKKESLGQPEQRMLAGLSDTLIPHFTHARDTFNEISPAQEKIDEDLRFWESLGEMIYAFNGLLKFEPRFIKVARYLEKLFKQSPLLSHTEIILTLISEFKFDYQQASILYKTWWYHPTSNSEFSGKFTKDEPTYSIRANDSKTTANHKLAKKPLVQEGYFQGSFTYSEHHLIFQSVSPLDRFIDWHVRDLLMNSNLWFLNVDDFLAVFEGLFMAKVPKFLAFNPERVRRTHFDLCRLYRQARKDSGENPNMSSRALSLRKS